MLKTDWQKISLTRTIPYRTLSELFQELTDLDATTKRLIDKLRDLEREITGLQHQADSIKMSLHLAGIKPEFDFDNRLDSQYAYQQPFRNLTLVETCKRILMDGKSIDLTKSEIEYLAVRGGYKFSTKDSKNSVDVTLRRLAAEKFCHVKRSRGPKGNSYFFVPTPDQESEH